MSDSLFDGLSWADQIDLEEHPYDINAIEKVQGIEEGLKIHENYVER